MSAYLDSNVCVFLRSIFNRFDDGGGIMGKNTVGKYIGLLGLSLVMSVHTHAITFDALKTYPNKASSSVYYAGKPTSNGVAVSKHSAFNQYDTLTIANYPDMEGGVAKTIVIEAGVFNLHGTIRIAGQTADLVIIGKNNGTSSCFNCTFENVNRVALSAGDTSLTNLTTVTKEAKHLRIGNLKAEGATVDLVAYNIGITGSINTNFLVYQDREGNYLTPDEHTEANRTLGAGAVNIFARGMQYDYNDQTVLALKNYSGNAFDPYGLGGTIKSAYIGVKSFDPIHINGRLDTSSHALASNANANEFKPVEEKIDIQRLANEHRGGEIVVNGTIRTQNDLSIQSSGFIYANSRANIEAKKLRMVAGDSLFNKGAIKADYMDLIAQSIFNDANDNTNAGMIQGDNVNLVVQESIENAYGGTIEAINLLLYSKKERFVTALSFHICILVLSVQRQIHITCLKNWII